MSELMLICKKCWLSKDSSEYRKSSSNKTGYTTYCKACCAIRDKDYYIKNRKKIQVRKKEKAFRPESKAIRNSKFREWFKNPENKARVKKWNSNPKIKDRVKARHKERYNNDINYKIKCSLRTRINQVIRFNFKGGSAVRDLGCSIADFKLYIESKFLPGMTWNNHSQTGWHLDHIIPLSSFNLSDREQFLKAVHFSNLQPLWAHDNLSKNDSVDWKLDM